MSTDGSKRVRFLSPVERFSEILFGLIMTLSITGTVSVVTGGREEVGTILLGVLGCNIAWGIIDGILYLLGAVSENGRGYALYTQIRQTRDPERTREVFAEALPPEIARVLLPGDFDAIVQRLVNLPDKPRRRVMTREDLGGAVGVFLLVVLSCIPLIIPFFFVADPLPALRVSNAVAILMLFLGGYFYAKYSGLPKIPTGIVMVVLGVLMVGLTVALGG
jgi:VIT1/CCC1 family predicted Fe2+/Mn2+ transporter